MSLHGLLSVTIGGPNVGHAAAYYADFGLGQEPRGWFTTTDGGRQLQLVHSPVRRLVDLRIGVDHQDDLAAAAARLSRLGFAHALADGVLETAEPVGATRAPPAAPT